MFMLVLGGAASGKSEYAERLAAGKGSGDEMSRRKLYLATMRHGPSAEARIRKHVKRREGLGFETLEDPLLEKDLKEEESSFPLILLEDIPNLLANRMFSPKDGDTAVSAAENGDSLPGRIAEAVLKLRQVTGELIVISGDVFRDGTEYAEETERYIAYLGELNCRLAKEADRVVEVVCGIPVDLKVNS